MKHWLRNILILTLWLECKGEDRVIQPAGDVNATEGGTVTLNCTFQTSATFSYLFWYKQEVNDVPKFILQRYSGTKDKPLQEDRIDATVNKTSVPLKIQKLQLSDSAVYYCALQPVTAARDKLIFGRGTRLTVEPSDESQPSFYKLGDSDPQVCLATDFSKHNVNSARRVFSETEAVLMDNLYSQVAVLPKGLEEECDEGSGGSGPCEDKLEQDPMVNLMSMTVLGLRLLFLKTIVFNVLMTFRLWISQ